MAVDGAADRRSKGDVGGEAAGRAERLGGERLPWLGRVVAAAATRIVVAALTKARPLAPLARVATGWTATGQLDEAARREELALALSELEGRVAVGAEQRAGQSCATAR